MKIGELGGIGLIRSLLNFLRKKLTPWVPSSVRFVWRLVTESTGYLTGFTTGIYGFLGYLMGFLGVFLGVFGVF